MRPGSHQASSGSTAKKRKGRRELRGIIGDANLDETRTKVRSNGRECSNQLEEKSSETSLVAGKPRVMSELEERSFGWKIAGFDFWRNLLLTFLEERYELKGSVFFVEYYVNHMQL